MANLLLHEKVNLLLNSAYSKRSNNIQQSITLAQKALLFSKELKDDSLTGKSLEQLAFFYMIISDFVNSKKYVQEAISYYTAINDKLGIANAKYTIASIHYKTDNYHKGLIHLIEALKIYKNHDDYTNISKVKKAIGTAYEFIGDQSNAFSYYKHAVKYAQKAKCTSLEANALNNLSGLLIKRKKYNAAMKMITHSIKLKKQSGDTRGYGFAIYGRGKVYLALGDYKNSEVDFLQAIDTFNKAIEVIGSCMVYNKLGKLYYKINDLEKSKETVLKGLELSVAYNLSMTKVKGYYLLYKIFKRKNKIKESFKYLELYLTEKEASMNTQTKHVMENYNLINKMNVLEKEALHQREKQKIIDKKNKGEQQALKVKQEFLSVMSHEIRTPLNAMTTIASILEDQVEGENKKLLKSLQFASNNLINIVNNVLDFNKLDAKKTALEVANTNLNDLCNYIVNLHSNVAKQKGLELIFINKVPNTRNYLLDETKLTQIISNLLSNAIKFTEKGKIVLKLKLKKEEEKHDSILIKVKDTGEGISKENSKKIFTSFSQIKPVMTRKQGGTGLGLAIVKKLVKLHQSKIYVKSKEQEGSEFYFTLQLEKTTPTPIVKKPISEQLKGKTVLLAEDTLMNAVLIKKVLLKWGVTTKHVSNGKIAVEYAKTKKYDFILMDLHMPEMNGIDATKLIRLNTINNNTPIFAITADVMTTQNKEYSELFNAILWKPINIEKLHKALTTNKTLALESTLV
ncbi:response regulator [Lacinutrix sp. C3R15]|uniref:ATP-binding response regulator n=1 Tax=Flavobacteriaceae TaxID=49546 RepID=UPI001C0A1B11|nr:MULTISPECIES: ATP-binding protein [Flavobacteriaceae]MBU2939490.1 response regulator [Lacinutrix sp. C3R15]MDO6622805.1 ATP-binding protein [Oceanihabitans sp. 1_MG-2023]